MRRGLFLHCPPFPLVRSTGRKSLVRAPTVLVLSTIHPSFQPILNLNQIDPRPFPHPSNNHVPTTSQPSFGSNTRTTRFRLNLPTSLIRQLQPILKNNSPQPALARAITVLILSLPNHSSVRPTSTTTKQNEGRGPKTAPSAFHVIV